MRCAGEIIILVAGAGVNEDTNRREGSWNRFSSNSNAVREGREIVQFRRILRRQ
jgi:hypothetical protein